MPIVCSSVRKRCVLKKFFAAQRSEAYLGDSLGKIHAVGDTDELRGLEGVNASCYFSVFDDKSAADLGR